MYEIDWFPSILVILNRIVNTLYASHKKLYENSTRKGRITSLSLKSIKPTKNENGIINGSH